MNSLLQLLRRKEALPLIPGERGQYVYWLGDVPVSKLQEARAILKSSGLYYLEPKYISRSGREDMQGIYLPEQVRIRRHLRRHIESVMKQLSTL